MPYLDAPAGPDREKLMAVIEASLLTSHPPNAVRRSSAAIHLSTPKNELLPRWARVLLTGPLGWLAFLARPPTLVETAHARPTSTSSGWRVETGGNHLMHQYTLLLELNEALFERGLQTEVLRDRTRDRLMSE